MGKSRRKATKRKVRRKAKSDRCQPLRDQIELVEDEIRNIEKSLSDPDIPAGIKRRLEALLKRRKAFLRNLERMLAQCEALGDHPG